MGLNLLERLNENKTAINYPEESCFGIFLFGSQNYDLDTVYSDVDSKMILFPTESELIYQTEPSLKTISLANGDQVSFITINSFYNQLLKGSPTALEFLFSKAGICNFEYRDVWAELVEERENLARLVPRRSAQSLLGQMISYDKTMGTNEIGCGKKYASFFFLASLLNEYLDGKNYEDCLVPKGKLHFNILSWKLIDPSVTSQEILHDRAKFLLEDLKTRVDDLSPDSPSKELTSFLKLSQYRLMRRYFEKLFSH